MSCDPAIIVIAYNRPHTLLRLLQSLATANYPAENIQLVLSIDFSDSDAGEATRQVAQDFEWPHGNKRLISHKENLGLRNHVLSCGDLSQEYGSIIVLEDDLSVGPEFYGYAKQALDFSRDQPTIAGVSLYHHQTNFLRALPFEPIDDGYDNYYLQIASSWGQCWSAQQWTGFRSWYDNLRVDDLGYQMLDLGSSSIHSIVAKWPQASWLRYFIGYLAASKKYFLYPRIAHSTNHSNSGSNVIKSSPAWQVPLGVKLQEQRFSRPEQSLAVYDSFFELEPSKVHQLAPALREFDFATDLYGSKDFSEQNIDLVLTSKTSSDSPTVCFPLETKPLELNLRTPCETEESYFRLVPTTNLQAESSLDLADRRVLEYFHSHLPLKKVVRSLAGYWWNR